jgi:two-component system invasion response regulator UvrY
MIHVLIADDHPVVRRGLRQILSETQDIVVEGEAGSAAEVFEQLRARPHDVLVLDLKLGDTSGLDVMAQLRKEQPRLPVIILTIYPEDQYAIRAVRSGAAGFLTKETAPERLIEAVRRVARGGRYVTAEVAEHLASYIASDEPAVPHHALSNRELQVLEMLAGGQTVGEIARTLHLSVKTVSTHRARLLAKMHMRTNAELTHYAVKNALV